MSKKRDMPFAAISLHYERDFSVARFRDPEPFVLTGPIVSRINAVYRGMQVELAATDAHAGLDARAWAEMLRSFADDLERTFAAAVESGVEIVVK